MPSDQTLNLIDTHCHLANGRLYQQVPDVLLRAGENGVNTVICATADVHEARTALAIARKHDNVYFTAGIHPHEAANACDASLGQIKQLSADPLCVAVGEIGLDYYYDHSPRPEQQDAFAKQLALATELNKPIVIHSRDAFEDTVAIIEESAADPSRMLFHSFTYGPDAIKRLLDLGVWISFSGIVTFKRTEELRQAAKLVPDDRFMLETDAPFLSPEPVRKMKVNEPANVAHIARCLANVRGTTPETIAEQTTHNACRFFGLPEKS